MTFIFSSECILTLTNRFPFGQTKIQLFKILRSLEAVPGVQIDTGAEVKTPAVLRMPDDDEDMPDVDQRPSGKIRRMDRWCLSY